MTAKKAINLADKRIPGNGYSTEEKYAWLTSLEMMCIRFVRELGYAVEDIVLGEELGDRELLIGEPYSECYVLWLIMKMHYYNGEVELYNNSAEAVNSIIDKAQKAFIRENRAKKSHSFSSYREV